MPHDAKPPKKVSNTADEVSGQVVQTGVVHGDVNVYQSPASHAVGLPLRTGLVPQRAAAFQERTTSAILTRTLDNGDAVILVSDVAQAAVLSGMGGVGKTQLAADYAERMWAASEVSLLVWVTATSRDAVVSGYADVTARLTGHGDLDPERGARTLLEWLATTAERWLVVLDDLQTPADLTGLWPPVTGTGQVVVTTRRRDAALRGHRRQLVEVGVFNENEALAYLRTVLAAQTRLLDGAEDLVRDLGYLPVALAQAGAYMVDKHLSCAEYRVRFAKRRLANVMPDLDGLPDEHRTTVATTWSLSVEQANQLAPEGVARPLLEVASVLDANGIPINVFTTRAALAFLATATGQDVDESDARDGLGCLHRLNLITLDMDSVSREVQVHALVQRATRDAWPGEWTQLVVRSAADAVQEVWPEVDRDRLLGQVLRANTDALAAADQECLWQPRAHGVFHRAGRSLGKSGLVVDAMNYFDDLRKIATRYLGSDHPEILTLRHGVATYRGEAGDAAGAVAAFEQLLIDYLRVLGPDHPYTLIARNNLAYYRGEAGDAAGAVAAFEQLLADRLRVLGPDHTHTLITRSNLGRFRAEAGDAAGAVIFLEQTLTDCVRIFGPEHSETLIVRGNLARWRKEAGDVVGALTANEQLLADRLRVLGPDHPNTLVTRHNLAFCRGDAGDPAGAASAFEQLLDDRLRILGPDHPATLVTRDSLAYWKKRAEGQAG